MEPGSEIVMFSSNLVGDQNRISFSDHVLQGDFVLREESNAGMEADGRTQREQEEQQWGKGEEDDGRTDEEEEEVVVSRDMENGRTWSDSNKRKWEIPPTESYQEKNYFRRENNKKNNRERSNCHLHQQWKSFLFLFSSTLGIQDSLKQHSHMEEERTKIQNGK